MRQDLEKLFTHLQSPEPSSGLENKINNRINAEIKLAAIKRRLVLFGFCAVGSGIAVFYACYSFGNLAAESGLWQYLSLLFSDYEVIFAIWQNYILSLAQALPLTGLIFMLASFFAFCESIKLLSKDLNKIKLALS